MNSIKNYIAQALSLLVNVMSVKIFVQCAKSNEQIGFIFLLGSVANILLISSGFSLRNLILIKKFRYINGYLLSINISVSLLFAVLYIYYINDNKIDVLLLSFFLYKIIDYIIDVSSKIEMIKNNYNYIISIKAVSVLIFIIGYLFESYYVIILYFVIAGYFLAGKTRFNKVSNSLLMSGLMLLVVSISSASFSAAPRILTAEFFSPIDLSEIGGMLYLASFSSHLVAPAQNKMKSDIISSSSTKLTMLVTSMELWLSIISQWAILLLVWLFFEPISVLLLGDNLSLRRDLYPLIALGFAFVTITSYSDVYYQLNNLLTWNLFSRLLSLIVFVISFYFFHFEHNSTYTLVSSWFISALSSLLLLFGISYSRI